MRVAGVQAEAVPAYAASRKAGTAVTVDVVPTVADGRVVRPQQSRIPDQSHRSERQPAISVATLPTEQHKEHTVTRLQDKIAIVTGSGQGLGRSIARLFAREGASVVVAEINENPAQETTELIVADGGNAPLFSDRRQ